MARQIAGFIVFVSVTLFCLTLCVYAQSAEPGGPPQNNPPGIATPPIQVAVTGCLKRSHDGGYYLSDQNGNIWMLSSDKVDLAKHVMHSVTLTGKPGAIVRQQGAGQEQSSGTQTGGNHTHTLQVLTLKLLDASCTR